MSRLNDRASTGGLFDTSQRAAAAEKRPSIFSSSLTLPPVQNFTGIVDDDLLSLSYPAFAPRIKAARDSGFADEEIENSIAERRENALAMGFRADEVDQTLGITPQSRRRYISTVLAGRDDIDAVLMDMKPEQLNMAYEQARKAGLTREEAQKMTARQKLVHGNDVSLLSDYVDIVEDQNKKKAFVLPHLFMTEQSDIGPKSDLQKTIYEKAGKLRDYAYKRTLGGYMIGAMASTEGILRGGAYLAHVTNWQNGYDHASALADYISESSAGMLKQNYAGVNQNLWDAAMQGLGSEGVYLLFGTMAGKLAMLGDGARKVSLGKRFAFTLAKLTGAGAQASLESLSEAGSVYEDILKRSGDEDAATSGASWTFLLNMPLNWILDKFAYWGEDTNLRKWIPKVVKSSERMQNVLYKGMRFVKGGFTEGTQETMQGAISGHFGEGTDWSALDLSQIAYEQGLPALLVGGVMGSMTSSSFKAMAEQVDAEEKYKAKRKEAIASSRRLLDRGSVYSSVKQVLVNSGADAKQAAYAANLFLARGAKAAKQQGITIKEWLAKQGLVSAADAQSGQKNVVTYNQTANDAVRMQADNIDNTDYNANREQFITDNINLFSTVAKAEGFSVVNLDKSNLSDSHYLHLTPNDNIGTDGKVVDGTRVYTVRFSDHQDVHFGSGLNLDFSSKAADNADKLREYIYARKDESGITRQESDKNFAKYLKDLHNRVFPSAEARLDSDMRLWAPTVEEISTEGQPKDGTRYTKPFRLMETPVAMVAAGAEHLPVVMPISVLQRMVKKFSKDVVKQLPSSMADPVMIVDNPKFKNQMFVLLDLIVGDKSLMLPLKLDKDTKKHRWDANEVIAGYIDRMISNKQIPVDDWIINEIQRGAKILYFNKQKNIAWQNNLASADIKKKEVQQRHPRIQYVPEAAGNPPSMPDIIQNNEKIDNADLSVKLNTILSSIPENTPNETTRDEMQKKTDFATYYQQEPNSKVKGYVQFVKDTGKTVLGLIQGASDATTLIHETGHVFLEDMSEFMSTGEASAEDQADWATLMKWLEVDDWQKLTAEQKTAAHEKFARGFERYLYEGVSPNRALEKVFLQFRDWMLNVYDSANDIGVEMDDDVRGVFDRMLGMDDETSEFVSRKTADVDMMENSTDTTEDVPAPETGNVGVDEEMPPDEKEAYDEQTSNAKRLIEANEEDSFDPSVWKLPNENNAENIDNMLRQEEQTALAKQAHQSFMDFADRLLAQGGLSYKSLVNEIGLDAAREVYRKAPFVFREAAGVLSDVAAKLGIPVNDIIDRLRARPESPKQAKVLPVVAVDEETLPWLIDRMGLAGARDYMKRRLLYVEKQIAATTKLLENARASGDATAEMLYRRDAAQYYKEQQVITDAVKGINASTEDNSAKDEGNEWPAEKFAKWSEFASKAKQQAARWTNETVKEAIDRVTGKTVIGDLISEREAINEAYAFAETESKRAFKAGSKEGMLIAAAREKAAKAKRAERAAVRGKIKRLVRDIGKAARADDISWDRKQEISRLLDEYDLHHRSKGTLENRQSVSDYFAQAKADAEAAGIEFDPESTNINEADMDMIGRRTLNNMTIDELAELHEKVQAIHDAGREEYQVWQARNKQETDELADELLKEMGGPKANTEGVIVPGKTQRGAKTSIITSLQLQAQTPSRILDLFDDYADFKGAFHRIFMQMADKAEDNYLVAREKRLNAIAALKEKYNMTPERLMENRASYEDAGSGETQYFTLNECLGIYVAWHNKLNRDALKYGNNISDELAAKIFSSLSEDETAFATEVSAEQGGQNTQRYDSALKDAYNIGIVPEPYYMRMYRSSWTDAKGEAIDEGIDGMLKDFVRMSGIRRLYSERGSGYSRKIISAQFQEPVALGLMDVWQRAMDEHEHFIAYGKLVKQLHSIVGERTDKISPDPIPGMKESIINTYGKEAYTWLVEYINRLAKPDFYKSYKATDQMARKVRANVGVAYLWGNIASFMKQPQALAYFLRDAGIVHLLSSIAEFTASPSEIMHKVWELDPQVKDQKINRILEELKATNDDSWMRFKKQYEEIGFKPMEWMDMLTRVIGWNAVYKAELARGATQEEARYRAQRATLNTQNAAHPKELPSYMMQNNELMNMLTQFTNQANKIFGVTTHDLYGDFKKGRWHKGFLSLMSLFIGAWLMSFLKYGQEPLTSGNAFKRLFVEETLGNIPIMGSGFSAYATKFNGGSTPFDDAAQDLAKGISKGFNGEYGDAVMSLYTAYSLLVGGLPVTAVKRAVKFIETGKVSDLTGLMRQTERSGGSLNKGF